ncbi:hypothetical protein P3T26_007521 [Streptomyces sp. MAA16]|nr:hypothetical protein [Streptomyces sp. MAA16]
MAVVVGGRIAKEVEQFSQGQMAGPQSGEGGSDDFR